MKALARVVRQEKEIKGIQIGKEKIKLSLFADDVLLYIENLKTLSKKKLLELINEFSIVAVYKVNIQKYVAFVYTNNELSEIKKTIPYISASKRINITKEMKYLYTKHHNCFSSSHV